MIMGALIRCVTIIWGPFLEQVFTYVTKQRIKGLFSANTITTTNILIYILQMQDNFITDKK